MGASRLTPEAMAELREIFSHFDHNKNGVIETSEFAALLDALDANASAEEIDAGIQALDENRNGTIEFDEFVAWWADR